MLFAKKITLQALSLFLALLLLPSITLALSFSANPSVMPTNATTTSSLACEFTPVGTGTLQANITWWYNDGSWQQYTGSDESIAVSDGVAASSDSISSSLTTKNENWLCQVTLYNESDALATNATAITIQNSPPIVTYPTTNQTVYEDALFSLTAVANDPDGDSITTWISPDLNASDYNDTHLFTISPGGLISFTLSDELKVGNHTVSLLAYDGSEWGGRNIRFEVFAVNDPPFVDEDFTHSCDEASWCNFTFPAEDEEGDTLTFLANESFINMNATGFSSFIPAFEDVGVHTIAVNVSDATDVTTATFNLTIVTINHIPEFNFNTSATSLGVQNQTERFLFYVNATDIDPADAISFSVQTSCENNPWNITTLANGTGSQNASGLINMSFSSTPGFIPNDFVVCRNITVVAHDGKEDAFANFTLQINNSNDPPTIYTMSYYDENGAQNNMSNISSAKGLTFGFRVNATDIDNLTYEGETWNFSLANHDPSKFEINTTSGLISSLAVMDDAYVGSYSFLVVVTDDEGVAVNKTVNLTVINNSAPVIRALNATSCTEDIPCVKSIIADDAENNIFNYTLFSLTYTPPAIINGSFTYNTANSITYTDSQVRSLFVEYVNFNVSSLEYQFNITPEDADVGLYELNVTFKDLFSATASDSVTFNVTNVNDEPLLDNDENQTNADPIVLFPAVKDKLFQKVIYAIDDDLFYNLDNLTFDYSLESGSNISANDFNLTKISNRSALLSFFPNETHLGTHKVNFTVTDEQGGTDLQQVNLTVYTPSIPPNITKIRPYATGVNATVNTLVSTATYPSPTTVYVSEGESLTFEIEATDVDSASQNLTLHWLYEGEEKKTSNYISSKTFTKSFDFFSSGSRTVLLNLSDELYSYTTYEWDVVVHDSNQQPYFLNNLANLSVAENSSVSGPQTFIDFFRMSSLSNIVFIDPDDDANANNVIDGDETNTLSFSVNESGTCGSYATFDFTGRNLRITPTAVGTCYTNFIATDPNDLQAVSNTVQIDILSLDAGDGEDEGDESNTRVVQQRVTIPLEEEIDVPEEFQLIRAGISTIYENGTVVVPIILENTWDRTLTGIHLSANASLDELTLSFSEDYVASLPVDAKRELNLTLRNYRLEAPFEINISAVIDSLDHTDVETVFVNALEKGKEGSESIKSKIGFARDLLSDNPECQELNELLDKAEKNEGTDEETSLEMVNAVIRGCKYLINTENKPESSNPESFLGKLGLYTNALIDVRALITVLVALTLGAVGIGLFTRFKLNKKI